MNFQQLEYIIALEKHKSFSKAAEVCHVTQATLSTMVKKLEDELNVVLFDRKTNPIILTDEGREILREAHQILHHSNQLKQISSNFHEIVEGEIAIGIIPTVAGNLLHKILPELLVKFPKLKLNILEITTANVLNKLKNNEIDMGIVSTPLKVSGLEEEILYYEKLMVYGVEKTDSLRFRSPDELSESAIWLLERGNCLTNQVINICSLQSKPVFENLDFHPNSFETLLNLVDSLSGLTLIPELYYHDLSEVRKSKVNDFVAPYPVREISIIYFRPYAKLKLIQLLAGEIRRIIHPFLETRQIKNSEMLIAGI